MDVKVTKSLLMTALITGSVLWGGTAAFAEESVGEFALDQIVVTATRTEKKIIDVPASVFVVTAKVIENSGAVTPDDIFKKVPGVVISRTGGLANSKPLITMRGVKSGSDVLVLVDGQVMDNAYSGVVNWNDIPVESIEKIEVVKGPGSSIYGSNAMAGVINITTKTSDKLHAKTSITYGTNHTWIRKVNLGDKAGKFSYDLYYQGTDSYTYSDAAYGSLSTDAGTVNAKGYQIVPSKTGKGEQAIYGRKGNKDWNEDNYKGKFTYKFDDSKTLTLGYIKTKNEYHTDYGSHENWMGKTGTIKVDGGKSFKVYKSSFDGAPGGIDERIYTLGYNDKENGLNVTAGLTDNRSWNGGKYTTSKTDLSKYDSKRYTLGVTKESKLSDNDNAIFGVQYQHDEMDKVKIAKADLVTISQAGAGKSDTYGIFFQNEHSFNDKLSAIAALRYDHWTVKDGYAYDKNGLDTRPDSRSDSAISPKLALNYKFDDTQSTYISWGKAFSAPSLYDMFAGTVNGATSGNPEDKNYVIPNPGLSPQIITTTEAGYKKSFGEATTVQLAVFHNKIKNINYQGKTGNYSNIADDAKLNKDDATSPYEERQLVSNGEGKTIGLEIGVNHQFNQNLSGYASAVIQNPQITKGAKEEENDKVVRMTPKRILSVGLDYIDGKFNTELSGYYYSKKFGSADNSDIVNGVPGTYDPVFLMNLTANYKFDKNHALQFTVNNLLDREYYNSSLGQGRNYLLTYSYSF